MRTAVVLTTDPAYPYDKDPAKWTANVADPMWQLTRDAAQAGGTLQRVNNFDAQVAGDTQATALYALILSAVVILAYVWLRFGNLKYGTATVLAMLHDVALVIGAVGLSHYIAEVPWLAKLLLVEPFRVNLTIVAAVLTVMRLQHDRHDRGVRPHPREPGPVRAPQPADRQRLDQPNPVPNPAHGRHHHRDRGRHVRRRRTGIHGFTFVLLVGILVGTYSSIAIAAPILLLGGRREAAGRPAAHADRSGRVIGAHPGSARGRSPTSCVRDAKIGFAIAAVLVAVVMVYFVVIPRHGRQAKVTPPVVDGEQSHRGRGPARGQRAADRRGC